jgi:hypothetical protein
LKRCLQAGYIIEIYNTRYNKQGTIRITSGITRRALYGLYKKSRIITTFIRKNQDHPLACSFRWTFIRVIRICSPSWRITCRPNKNKGEEHEGIRPRIIKTTRGKLPSEGKN